LVAFIRDGQIRSPSVQYLEGRKEGEGERRKSSNPPRFSREEEDQKGRKRCSPFGVLFRVGPRSAKGGGAGKESPISGFHRVVS